MYIPKLNKSKRSREFNMWPEEKRDSVIYHYLFKGKSNRELDSDVLELDSNYSRGYQSMGILHHLGLNKDFKGIFRGVSIDFAIDGMIEIGDKSYYPIIMALKRYDKGILVIEEINDYESEVEVVGTEGKKVVAHYVTKYERNQRLRKEAIKLHGTICEICGFDFEKKYGLLGKNFIEVHHIKPLYSLKEETLVNPLTDLVCVCSNCHRMLHKYKNKIITPEELKKILKKNEVK